MNVKQIIELLASSDEKQVKKALSGLKSDGDATVIVPLAELLLKDRETGNYQKEILEIFSSLKDTSTVDTMIEVIRDEHFLPVRQLLLSTIWNTSLDYTSYLADFVLIACEGDFLEALDCLTILENLNGEIEERQAALGHRSDQARLHRRQCLDRQPALWRDPCRQHRRNR